VSYSFKSDIHFYDVPDNSNEKMTHQVYINFILEPVGSTLPFFLSPAWPSIPSSVSSAALFSEQIIFFSGDRRRGGKIYYLFAKECCRWDGRRDKQMEYNNQRATNQITKQAASYGKEIANVVTMQPRLLHCGAKLRMQLSSMTVSAQ
jgi:hypothetical protein